MFSTRATPPSSKMFFTIVKYFTSQCHYNQLYKDDGDNCRIVVEPHLIDIEKGKYCQ